MIKALLASIAKLSPLAFLLWSLPVALAMSVALLGLGLLLGLSADNMYRPEPVIATGPVGLFLIGSVVAPLFERLVFQQWPKRLLTRFDVEDFRVYALCSALPFAAAHSLHPMSFLLAFGGGLLLALSFASRDYAGGRPFWLTAGAHSIRNTFSTLLFYLW